MEHANAAEGLRQAKALPLSELESNPPLLEALSWVEPLSAAATCQAWDQRAHRHTDRQGRNL